MWVGHFGRQRVGRLVEAGPVDEEDSVRILLQPPAEAQVRQDRAPIQERGAVFDRATRLHQAEDDDL
ncbi:MAG TPA: hypothetical protein VKT82_23160 [Ktedonobacterales bacterium]|nr:hypothetical protein [Ktedonobacterales bacterium]